MERLQKYMAHAGVASRRKSEEIIARGRVRVNGKVVTELGTKINPETDVVRVDGREITREKRVYVLLNKPTGYVTTVSDPRDRKTVLDLIKGIEQRIYPVGRLDYDTGGLLLLTNDGELTYILTHPSYEIEKTYQVEIKGEVTDEELIKLENGIMLEDGLTAPAQVKLIKREDKKTIFSITIHEGRNRQVRRMCKAIGYWVNKLDRIRFGFLTLEGLKRGSCRFLKKREIKKLKDLEGIH